MDVWHIVGLMVISLFFGCFTVSMILIYTSISDPTRQKKRKISFATRKKCKQLRRAGEDSRAALRKFHDTKKAARIEANQSWQARYDELVPVPVQPMHVMDVGMVPRRAMVHDDGSFEYLRIIEDRINAVNAAMMRMEDY